MAESVPRNGGKWPAFGTVSTDRVAILSKVRSRPESGCFRKMSLSKFLPNKRTNGQNRERRTEGVIESTRISYTKTSVLGRLASMIFFRIFGCVRAELGRSDDHTFFSNFSNHFGPVTQPFSARKKNDSWIFSEFLDHWKYLRTLKTPVMAPLWHPYGPCMAHIWHLWHLWHH